MEMKERLLSSQQTELDAVGMYKKIAEALENETHKAMILEIAADEGKHSAIIKRLTNEDVVPNEEKAAGTEMMIKTMGMKAVLAQFRQGEINGEKNVTEMCKCFDEFKLILPDEQKHIKYLEQILAEME
ncbi:MAG: hypothetical protein IJL97_03360 [Lachnospiraceae bacterium]|nr:hypothetical protein [Lachnospiraceae bacterium]